MIRINRYVLVGIAVLGLPAVSWAQSITLNQIDTFDPVTPPATTMNWAIGIGGFTGPTLEPGPTGNFLQLVSGAFPAPPRWAVFNQVQWAGNYNAPNPPGANPVNAIEMDIANFSTTVASMRLTIKQGPGQTPGYSFIGGSGVNGAHDIPADGVFRHYVFPISSSTMAPVNDPFGTPPAPFNTVIQSVGELRIVQSISPAVMGDAFVGRIGVDNIQAVFMPIPEPTGILAASAIAFGVANMIRRRRGVH